MNNEQKYILSHNYEIGFSNLDETENKKFNKDIYSLNIDSETRVINIWVQLPQDDLKVTFSGIIKLNIKLLDESGSIYTTFVKTAEYLGPSFSMNSFNQYDFGDGDDSLGTTSNKLGLKHVFKIIN